jgi:16S rRNA (guanine527-N7)-methyltransferase
LSPQPDSLDQALDRHGIDLPTGQRQLIDRYCQLLWEMNSQLNLTRHTDYETFVARDVIDSLQLAKHLRAGEQVLDVGSGGGVPGILLAILRPDVSLSLSECVGKKANVLKDMIAQLELPVSVYRERAENVVSSTRFDTLVGRAVGPLAKVLKWFAPHWHEFGRLLLIKGPHWVQERAEARQKGLLRELHLRRLESYQMAARSSESVVLSVCQKAKRESAASGPEDER